MVTTTTNDRVHEFYGLSTDAKPANKMIGNGSIFVEMDTCRVFMFDEESKT